MKISPGVLLLLTVGCSDSGSETGDEVDDQVMECGGCALPAPCDANGQPLYIAPCSCGGCSGKMCHGGAATLPTSAIEAPTEAQWMSTVQLLTPSATPFPVQITPLTCGTWSSTAELERGTAYVQVYRTDDGQCEVWLGGATDDPAYDGAPTQYCRFPSECVPLTAGYAGEGGPATIDSPYCVTLD